MITGADQETNDLANRLSVAIRAAGGPSLVSRSSGLSLRNLSRYMNQGIEPPATALAKIASACNVSTDSLLFDRSVSAKVTSDLLPDAVYIPAFRIDAAGPRPGSVADLLIFPKELLNQFGVELEFIEFLRVPGDSMAPTIKDGSIALIDRSRRDLISDAIYVISMGNDVRVKRIQKGFDGSITLISDNRDLYLPERISKADAEQLQIAGRVFWVGNQL